MTKSKYLAPKSLSKKQDAKGEKVTFSKNKSYSQLSSQVPASYFDKELEKYRIKNHINIFQLNYSKSLAVKELNKRIDERVNVINLLDKDLRKSKMKFMRNIGFENLAEKQGLLFSKQIIKEIFGE